MACDWQGWGWNPDLADLLTPFASRLTTLVPAPLQKLRALVDKRIPQGQENTPGRPRANIAADYDLSNDLFAAFLDPNDRLSGLVRRQRADCGGHRPGGAQLRKDRSASSTSPP